MSETAIPATHTNTEQKERITSVDRYPSLSNSAIRARTRSCQRRSTIPSIEPIASCLWKNSTFNEDGAGNRPRNTMRLRNLTDTGIILALGTERLYLEPARTPTIVRWTQHAIGMRHIEFGASHQCLQVPILEDIAHVEGIPDPEPFTLFLVDPHVFSNCDRKDVFTYSTETEDGNGNVIIGYLVGK